MSEFLTFAAQEILTKVASLAAQEFSLVWGFKGELTQLRESFSMLEAMLRDAEQSKGSRGEAVEIWVKKLEEIAHDADDVLDEYGYELLRRKVELQNQMKKKVLNFFSLSNPIAFRLKMAHKIQNINKSLVILTSKADGIGLVAIKPIVEATTSHNMRGERETHSGLDENIIFGRDQVVSDIVEALTDSNKNQESKLSVMAIVGLGGLGKTTVAKSIFHDAKIQAHFHERLWVCVSTPFEIQSILRGVLESLKSKNAAVQTIEAMCGFLKEELQGKRYLLVLDDVWNEDSHRWDDLRSCLLRVTDTRGSKIIVTTRSDKVGKIVETLLPRPDLEKLSVEDCWRILKNTSMGSAPVTEEQERIGRRIATKCGGVPLVAKQNGDVGAKKEGLFLCLYRRLDLRTRMENPEETIFFRSTIGEMLAKETNCSFIDADDFHPQSNKGEPSAARRILREMNLYFGSIFYIIHAYFQTMVEIDLFFQCLFFYINIL